MDLKSCDLIRLCSGPRPLLAVMLTWFLWWSVLKKGDWEPIQAFDYDRDSQKVCETERLKHVEADYQLGGETYAKTGITTPERLRSLRVLAENSHHCLPDTIDPRGPKGKRADDERPAPYRGRYALLPAQPRHVGLRRGPV